MKDLKKLLKNLDQLNQMRKPSRPLYKDCLKIPNGVKQYDLEAYENASGATFQEKINMESALTTMLPDNPSYRSLNGEIPALFSNELQFVNVLNTFTKTTIPIDPTKTNLAILVGHSNLPSILPELKEQGVELVLLVDYDAVALANTMYDLFSLRFNSNKTGTPPSSRVYRATYLNHIANPVLVSNLVFAKKGHTQFLISKDDKGILPSFDNQDMDYRQNMLNLYQLSSGSLLDIKHCLSSEERFSSCQSAAQKMPVFAVPTNLLGDLQSFMRAMEDEKGNSLVNIVLINVSNIHHYDHAPSTNTLRDVIFRKAYSFTPAQKLIKNLSDLILTHGSPQTIFWYSVVANSADSPADRKLVNNSIMDFLTCQSAIGVDELQRGFEQDYRRTTERCDAKLLVQEKDKGKNISIKASVSLAPHASQFKNLEMLTLQKKYQNENDAYFGENENRQQYFPVPITCLFRAIERKSLEDVHAIMNHKKNYIQLRDPDFLDLAIKKVQGIGEVQDSIKNFLMEQKSSLTTSESTQQLKISALL